MAVLGTKCSLGLTLMMFLWSFAAVPSSLCGQMSWSLFGLGRRMFEENLYDATPSIIELFPAQLGCGGLSVPPWNPGDPGITPLSRMEFGFQLPY